MRLELDQWDVTLNGIWQQDAATDNRYWHKFTAGDLSVYLSTNQNPRYRHHVQVSSERPDVDSLRINSTDIRSAYGSNPSRGWVQNTSSSSYQRWQIDDGHAGIVDVQPTTDGRVLVDIWPPEGYDRLVIRSRVCDIPTPDTTPHAEPVNVQRVPDPELEALLDEEEAIARRTHPGHPEATSNVETVEPTVGSYRRAFERLDIMLKAEATRRDWCDEYEEFVEQFNRASPLVQLSGRCDVEYSGQLNIDFTFDAGRNGAAREGMDVVRQAIDELLGRFTTLRGVTVRHNSTRR